MLLTPWQILWILVGLVVCYCIYREYLWVEHKYRNKYIIAPDEILPQVSYYSYPVDQICYVAWSGGPHSTALLCYLLIVLGRPVQPITILPAPVLRLKQVRSTLIANYPHLQSRLLPTWYVTSIDKCRHVTAKIKPLTHDTNQAMVWDSVARFAKTCVDVAPIMIGSVAPSAFLTIPLENITAPFGHMTHEEVKHLALDSKNPFWHIANQ